MTKEELFHLMTTEVEFQTSIHGHREVLQFKDGKLGVKAGHRLFNTNDIGFNELMESVRIPYTPKGWRERNRQALKEKTP